MTAVWAIIPARAGSKGVPGKNIARLAGHPLLAWSVRAAVKAPSISRVVLSTDNDAYAEIGRQYGAEAPFLRPAELAEDASPDLSFMQHAIQWFLENEGSAPDLWVHLRPTTPLRRAAVVDSAVEAFKDSGATALRSVHEMSESAYKAFEIEDGCLKQVGSGARALDAANAARQSFPATYYANGYVDVVRTRLVLDQGLLHGDRVAAFATEAVQEVDTVDDLAYLKWDAERRPEIGRALFT